MQRIKDLPKTPAKIRRLNNSCSLRAMCLLGLKPDFDGFCEHCGMYGDVLLKNVKKQVKVRKIPFNGKINQFALKHPKGKYLVFLKNHVGVIYNGRIGNCPKNNQIEGIFKIY